MKKLAQNKKGGIEGPSLESNILLFCIGVGGESLDSAGGREGPIMESNILLFGIGVGGESLDFAGGTQ